MLADLTIRFPVCPAIQVKQTRHISANSFSASM